VRDSAINTADGEKQQTIKASEANKLQQINEAEGQAEAILAVATATAEGLRRVADAIQVPGGFEALQLRVAEQYIGEFGKLAQKGNTLIVPADLSNVASMIELAMKSVRRHDGQTGLAQMPPPPRPRPNPNV
jgi:regulator of protease activity HflC (stomatin/prohibitin superfamily)